VLFYEELDLKTLSLLTIYVIRRKRKRIGSDLKEFPVIIA